MTIALWCVLAVALMPILGAGIAKWGTTIDNNNPRDWAASLEGYRRRAFAAHLNSYEFFPVFAVAVLAAQTAGAAQRPVDWLALGVVLARAAYLACYVADLATARSLVWTLAMAGAVAIFTSPAWT